MRRRTSTASTAAVAAALMPGAAVRAGGAPRAALPARAFAPAAATPRGSVASSRGPGSRLRPPAFVPPGDDCRARGSLALPGQQPFNMPGTRPAALAHEVQTALGEGAVESKTELGPRPAGAGHGSAPATPAVHEAAGPHPVIGATEPGVVVAPVRAVRELPRRRRPVKLRLGGVGGNQKNGQTKQEQEAVPCTHTAPPCY